MNGEKFTLKRAKEIAKQLRGHYPRPGYQMIVWSNAPYCATETVYLTNDAGKLSVTHYVSPNHVAL